MKFTLQLKKFITSTCVMLLFLLLGLLFAYFTKKTILFKTTITLFIAIEIGLVIKSIFTKSN